MNAKFDIALWKSQSVGQCVRPNRCSNNLVRRRWLATWRTMRLAKLGG